MHLDEKKFTTSLHGKLIQPYLLQNNKGLKMYASNYGARLLQLFYNDKSVIAHFDSIAPYMSSEAPYHGATVGRYANRIAKGKFALDGVDYSLPVNNPPNHLHGGPNGFHNQAWSVTHYNRNEIVFTYLSPDGEEGYPGNLHVEVTYRLTDDDEIIIVYKAQTDADTPLNITNHTFFNLNGTGAITEDELMINAGSFLPVDSGLIPTGIIKAVANTAFDFTTPKKIAADIEADEEQLKFGYGYDHYFVLNKPAGVMGKAVELTGRGSGIKMIIQTTDPGLQLFSGNYLAVENDPASFRNSVCFEPHAFPDAPNQPAFPSAILKAGQVFTSKTIYQFSESD